MSFGVRKRLLKAAEIRELFQLSSTARVYELARRGVLPGVVKVGRQIRFDRARICSFIDSGGQALAGGWRKEQRTPTPVEQDSIQITGFSRKNALPTETERSPVRDVAQHGGGHHETD